MRTTIDAGGRVVVPKSLRDRLGIERGAELDVGERDGVIEIRLVGPDVVVDRSGGKPVLRAAGAVPELTTDEVRRLVEQTRR